MRSASTSSGGKAARSSSAAMAQRDERDPELRPMRADRHAFSRASRLQPVDRRRRWSSPSARAAKLSAMRWRNTGPASATHIVDRRRRAGRRAARGRGRRASGLARARARAPGDVLVDEVARIGAGAGRAHHLEDRIGDALRRPGSGAPAAGPVMSSAAREHRLGASLLGAGGGEQHAPLGFEIGIGHVDLACRKRSSWASGSG